MNLGIGAIGSYVPAGRIDNHSRMERFDADEWFLENKIGFRFLARKSNEESTLSLCQRAYEALCASQPAFDPQSVDFVTLVTQNPDSSGLPHNSAILQGLLGLSARTACFDISLGCSGYVYALNIAQAFMQMQGLRNGLVFTADPYSKILNSEDRNTELLFGDGATCTWLSESPKYRLLHSCFATDGTKWDAIRVHQTTGKFEMKGKSVFKFSLQRVPEQILECLAKNNLSKADIDIYLVHQGSRYIVDNLAKILELPGAKLPFSAKEVGNTVSSTIPLSLDPVLSQDPLPKRILLSGFGVGLSWASTVLERCEPV